MDTELGHTIRCRIEVEEPALVSYEYRHWSVASDALRFLFAVTSAWKYYLLCQRGRLDMLRDEIDDALAPQIRLAILLAAAEHCFALDTIYLELIGPAFFTFEEDLATEISLLDIYLEGMSICRKHIT